VAIIGLPERVLIFTPGVPYMAPNGIMIDRRRRGENISLE
jgi:hypothetical protein